MNIRFEDLDFKDHERALLREHGVKVARITFENGYSASVAREIDVLEKWGSNHRYEVVKLIGNDLQASPMRELSKAQVVTQLRAIASLPKRRR